MQTRPTFPKKARILLADDDDALRTMLVEVLRSEGYEVLTAEEGESALTVARRTKGVIDLLITDVMMPRLDGFDLRERLRRERPNVRVLVMSGQLDEGISGEDFHLLRKPFTPERFLEKVRESLAAPVSLDAS